MIELEAGNYLLLTVQCDVGKRLCGTLAVNETAEANSLQSPKESLHQIAFWVYESDEATGFVSFLVKHSTELEASQFELAENGVLTIS